MQISTFQGLLLRFSISLERFMAVCNTTKEESSLSLFVNISRTRSYVLECKVLKDRLLKICLCTCARRNDKILCGIQSKGFIS